MVSETFFLVPYLKGIKNKERNGGQLGLLNRQSHRHLKDRHNNFLPAGGCFARLEHTVYPACCSPRDPALEGVEVQLLCSGLPQLSVELWSSRTFTRKRINLGDAYHRGPGLFPHS